MAYVSLYVRVFVALNVRICILSSFDQLKLFETNRMKYTLINIIFSKHTQTEIDFSVDLQFLYNMLLSISSIQYQRVDEKENLQQITYLKHCEHTHTCTNWIGRKRKKEKTQLRLYNDWTQAIT